MNLIQGILLGAVGALFIGLAIWIGVDESKIKSLQEALNSVNAEKAACLAENTNWKDASQQQNAALDALRDEIKKREDAAAAAVAKAQAGRDQATAQATSIMQQKVDADDCTGAHQVLKSYLQGRKP